MSTSEQKQFLEQTEARARELGIQVRWWQGGFLVLGLPESPPAPPQAAPQPSPDSAD